MRSNFCWPSMATDITTRTGTTRRFEIKRTEVTRVRPHGLSYSFTLHGPDGTRLVGFDNAHAVAPTGSRFKKRQAAADHWHRTENDPGRPYEFVSAEKLIDDFFDEIERVLTARGISLVVIADEKVREP